MNNLRVPPAAWPATNPPDLVRLAISAALAEAYSGVENEPLPEPLRAALRELELREAGSRSAKRHQHRNKG